MNIVSSITSKCRGLVETSSIAGEDKRGIGDKLDEIEKLLQEDRFAVQRSIWSGLPRFQKMLHHAQLLHDSPSANALSDIVAGCEGIIAFLLQKKAKPV